jgi:ComF family protein
MLKIKENILDILFPKFCINCRKEGSYLCEDCFYLIDIFENCYCPFCQIAKITKNGETCELCKKKYQLDGMLFATSYKSAIIKKMIVDFKYGFVKDLSVPLSLLIITHLIKLNRLAFFNNFSLIPVPLFKTKLKQRGFNQANEIAKNLSVILKLPIIHSCLKKTKNTRNQADLEKLERINNLKSVFWVNNQKEIKNKNILLVDDVFTTGHTLEECAKVLKLNGARKVWGIVIARA